MNAVRHGPVGPDGSLPVAVQWGPGGVQVEVGDPGRGPKLVHPRPRHDGCAGWGLVLVDRIADRWRRRFAASSLRKTLLKLELLPRWLTSSDFRLAFTSGVSANSVCFERELLDHHRLVFEKEP